MPTAAQISQKLDAGFVPAVFSALPRGYLVSCCRVVGWVATTPMRLVLPENREEFDAWRRLSFLQSSPRERHLHKRGWPVEAWEKLTEREREAFRLLILQLPAHD